MFTRHPKALYEVDNKNLSEIMGIYLRVALKGRIILVANNHPCFIDPKRDNDHQLSNNSDKLSLEIKGFIAKLKKKEKNKNFSNAKKNLRQVRCDIMLPHVTVISH